MRLPLFKPVMFASVVLMAMGATTSASWAKEDTWDQAQQLMRDGKHAEAEKLLEQTVKSEPDNAFAWYGLGLARHSLDDLDGAIEADRRAAEFPSVRPDALYNLACAYARLDRLEPASKALSEAIVAGFIDFDLMKTDPDIEIIRKAGRIEFPRAHKYETIKARNGVEIEYTVVLPENYNPSHTYPALVSFAPGGWGTASCDWSLEHLWGASTSSSGWIAVHLVAPDRGWMTHPSHHALEELLDDIMEDHHIEGDKFHLVGFNNGARPATTYSGMSKRYFQSLTTVNNRGIARWDDDELRSFSQKRVFLLVCGEDDYTLELTHKVEALMSQGGTEVKLTVLDGEGRVPASMLDGGLMRFLAENVRVRSGS